MNSADPYVRSPKAIPPPRHSKHTYSKASEYTPQLTATEWLPPSPSYTEFDAPLPQDRQNAYGTCSPVFRQRVLDNAAEARKFVPLSPPLSPSESDLSSADSQGFASHKDQNQSYEEFANQEVECLLVPVQVAGVVTRVCIGDTTTANDLITELMCGQEALVKEAQSQLCSMDYSQIELDASQCQLWVCESSIERPLRSHEVIGDVAETLFNADGAHLRLSFLPELLKHYKADSTLVLSPKATLQRPLQVPAYYFVPQTRQFKWQQVDVRVDRERLVVASEFSDLCWDVRQIDVCAVTTCSGWRSDAPGRFVLAIRSQLPSAMFASRQDASFCLSFDNQEDFDSALAIIYASRSHILASRELPIAQTFASLRHALYVNAANAIPAVDLEFLKSQYNELLAV